MPKKSNLCLLLLIAYLAFCLPLSTVVAAQDETGSPFFRAEVIEVLEKGVGDFGPFERLRVKIIEGEATDQTAVIDAGDLFPESASHDFVAGDRIVVRQDENGELQFVERYRLPAVYGLLVVFCLLCVVIGGKRGFYGLLGLLSTITVIGVLLVPQIHAGQSIYLIGWIALALIGSLSVLIAHGFHKTTLIALSGIGLTLSIASVFAWGSTHLAAVFGLGTETPLQVFLFGLTDVDFRGLFLIGTLLGALGVLDDVTTAQATVVAELKKANPLLSAGELYRGASAVGKEHIVSMINTLFLAYAGVSLPLLLLFYADPMPLWAFLNSEMMAEEIIRTVVGSSAILFSVPLTSWIAAVSYGRVRRRVPSGV